MRRIPVVFSVDNDYLPILATSVRSMLLNSGKDYFYEINVFYTDVSDYRRKLFCSDNQQTGRTSEHSINVPAFYT